MPGDMIQLLLVAGDRILRDPTRCAMEALTCWSKDRRIAHVGCHPAAGEGDTQACQEGGFTVQTLCG